MRVPYVKPESALQRAEELLEVKAPLEALNVLHHTLSARRSRNFVAVSLEPLVLKFLTLTVNLRKGLLAREGLHYYKKLAQSSNAASVEKVVHHFLSAAEARVKNVRDKHFKEAKQDSSDLISAIEDLDTPDTFDSVFSAMVASLEDGDGAVPAVSRRDRDPCTASIAFLWESYRMVLDLLRNNAKFEVLYQHTAKKAFEFCVKYKRKVEFRRLSDALNVHLQSLNRPQNVAYRQQPSQAINLSDPDVLQRYLDTRFLQLQTASDLELWQESFRSAEDICGLLMKAAEAIAPSDGQTPASLVGLLPYSLFSLKRHGTKLMQILVHYYEKLTHIFAYSEDPTFLAAAWNEYYSWTVNAKSAFPVSDDVQRTIASHVVLSAVCAPVLPFTPASDLTLRHHRRDRLTKMLGWTRVPDRTLLLADAVKRNILAHAESVVQQIHRILETEFHPLTTSQRLRALFSQVNDMPEFQRYLQPLATVTANKVLKHISALYTSMTFEHLLSLVSITPETMPLFELEKLVLQFNRSSEFEIHTDHLLQQFYFQEKAPKLPPVELLLQLPVFTQQDRKERAALFKRARENIQMEHEATHARQEEIERRKQQLENYEQQQLEQERTELLNKQQEERTLLQKKMAEAARQKEIEKIKREQENLKKTEAKKLSDTMKAKAGITIKSDSLNDIGREELLVIQENISSKEREALEQEMSQVMRKLDHMERAIRKEETPMLEKAKEEEKEKNRILEVELRKKALEEAKERHAQALIIMKRVQRMRKEAQNYRQVLEEERRDAIAALRKRAEAEYLEAKRKRRDEVRAQIRSKIEAENEMKRIAKEEEKLKEEARKKQEEERKSQEMTKMMKEREEAGECWIPAAANTNKMMERKVTSTSQVEKPAAAKQTAPARYVPPAVRTTTAHPLTKVSETENGPGSDECVPLDSKRGNDTVQRSGSTEKGGAHPPEPPKWERKRGGDTMQRTSNQAEPEPFHAPEPQKWERKRGGDTMQRTSNQAETEPFHAPEPQKWERDMRKAENSIQRPVQHDRERAHGHESQGWKATLQKSSDSMQRSVPSERAPASEVWVPTVVKGDCSSSAAPRSSEMERDTAAGIWRPSVSSFNDSRKSMLNTSDQESKGSDKSKELFRQREGTGETVAQSWRMSSSRSNSSYLPGPDLQRQQSQDNAQPAFQKSRTQNTSDIVRNPK